MKNYDGTRLKEPRIAWIETYLICLRDYHLDRPPGDNYHCWGFQGDAKLTKKQKQGIEDAINRARALEQTETTFDKFNLKRAD
jgi:hypothetical protein